MNKVKVFPFGELEAETAGQILQWTIIIVGGIIILRIFMDIDVLAPVVNGVKGVLGIKPATTAATK